MATQSNTMNNDNESSSPSGQGTQSSSFNDNSGQGNSGYTAPTSSGTFTNLQNYLNANKNFNSSQGGFAGQTYNNLASQANTLNNSINSSSNTFNSQAQANRNTYNSNLISQDLVDPTATTSNSNAYNQFENSLTGGYTGPTSLNNANTLQSQAANYKQLTGLTGSEQGRSALLSQLYGNNNYNQGQQTLDNMLLGSSPSSLATLQSAQQLGNNVNTNLQNSTNNASQAAQQYQQEAANTNKQTAQALNSSAQGFVQGLNNQLSAQQNDYNNQVSSALQQLQAGNVNSQLAQQLGLTPGTTLYNVDLANYLNQTAPTLNLNNIANQADVNTQNAYNKLAGNNITNTNLTPTSAPNALDFNSAAAQNALTQAQAAYQQAYNNPTAVVSGAGYGSSYANLLNYAQNVANAEYGGNLNSLQSATGLNPNSNAYQAQQYLNQINAFNQAQGLNNILQTYNTPTSSPVVKGGLSS